MNKECLLCLGSHTIRPGILFFLATGILFKEYIVTLNYNTGSI